MEDTEAYSCNDNSASTSEGKHDMWMCTPDSLVVLVISQIRQDWPSSGGNSRVDVIHTHRFIALLNEGRVGRFEERIFTCWIERGDVVRDLRELSLLCHF